MKRLINSLKSIAEVCIPFVLFALFVNVVHASAPTHCNANEKVIFSCPFKNGKTVSLCASPVLSKQEGTLQYRYGIVGKKMEMIFPEPAVHPSSAFKLYAMSGGRWYDRQISFQKSLFKYYLTAYSNAGIPEEDFSLSVTKEGKVIAEWACLDSKVIDESFSLERLGISQKTNSNKE